MLSTREACVVVSSVLEHPDTFRTITFLPLTHGILVQGSLVGFVVNMGYPTVSARSPPSGFSM